MSETNVPFNRPETRYGDQKKSGISGKVIAIFAIVMLAMVLVLVGRSVIQQRSIPVQANFVTQEAVDDNTLRVWVDITRRDASIPTYCIVTAVNYDFDEVGRREIAVPAGGDEIIHVGVDLPLREPAVSGRVYGCSENIPFYLDTSQTYTEAYPTPTP